MLSRFVWHVYQHVSCDSSHHQQNHVVWIITTLVFKYLKRKESDLLLQDLKPRRYRMHLKHNITRWVFFFLSIFIKSRKKKRKSLFTFFFLRLILSKSLGYLYGSFKVH